MTRDATFEQIGLAEPVVIAIDNGGTNTRISVTQGETNYGCTEYPTPTSYEDAINKLAFASVVLLDERRPDAIAYAIAGDAQDGTIVGAGQLEEYGWVGRQIDQDTADELGIANDRIVLLNDCVAAAKAQQEANRRSNETPEGYVVTISTGFGGAGFKDDELIPDEAGHHFLKDGAICGCGKVGCAEAHISGSGIERKYGIKAEDLPDEIWDIVLQDMVDAHVDLLDRLATEKDLLPGALYFFGSVALKQARVLPAIKSGLEQYRHAIPSPLPAIERATYGDDSGIVGARFAAIERAYQS